MLFAGVGAPTFLEDAISRMDIVISIVVTVLLTLVNGYFSMAEMSLSTAKRTLLEHEASEGDARAAVAAQAVENPDSFLAAIQVAITLVGFASSAFAATSLSAPFAAWMISLGLAASAAQVAAPVIITLLISYFSIVIGELTPKRIALSDAERIAEAVAGPLMAFSTIARPLVWLTSASADGVARVLHLKATSDRQMVSEDEIRYLVTDTDELSEEEKSMIHEVIGLGDTIAREVMVPRVDMTAVEDCLSCEAVLDIMRTTGFSRIPVYHEEVDHIIGIAHIKDLIESVLAGEKIERSVSQYVRKADFVPDTKDIIPLLSQMRADHAQMVIVVDEYGGTAGVVTIEDIVEEVVGEIEDEFDPDNRYLTQLSDTEWLVDGRYSIDDAIELGWPLADSGEYETIAGFVLDQADSLPNAGEKFVVDGWTFKVVSVRGRRIAKVRVSAPKPTSTDDAAALATTDALDGKSHTVR